MDRAKNRVCYHVKHIDWRGDCLIIYFLRKKEKQKGFGLKNTLACALQFQEPRDLTSECNDNVSFYTPIIFGGSGNYLLVRTSIEDTKI